MSAVVRQNKPKDYTIVGVVDYECNSSSEQTKDYTIQPHQQLYSLWYVLMNYFTHNQLHQQLYNLWFVLTNYYTHNQLHTDQRLYNCWCS
jgi:hypothetical protein